MADELARHYTCSSCASPRRPPSCSAATVRSSCSTTPSPGSTRAPSAPDATGHPCATSTASPGWGLLRLHRAAPRRPAAVIASSMGPCPDRAERGEDACAACRAGSEGQALALLSPTLLRFPLRDREHHHGMLRLSLSTARAWRTGSASSSSAVAPHRHGARRGTAHRAGAPARTAGGALGDDRASCTIRSRRRCPT